VTDKRQALFAVIWALLGSIAWVAACVAVVTFVAALAAGASDEASPLKRAFYAL
jgi:hypothetical protein